MIFNITHNPQLAMFIIRMTVGSVFVLHGGQKLFGWFAGEGFASSLQWLLSLGVPTWLGTLGVISEFIAGLFVLLGVATELGAFVLIVDMLFGIYLIHWSHGYFIQNNGFEYPLNLIFLCVALIVGGPGSFSLWRLI
jgi:putative oxidoreductase